MKLEACQRWRFPASVEFRCAGKKPYRSSFSASTLHVPGHLYAGRDYTVNSALKQTCGANYIEQKCLLSDCFLNLIFIFMVYRNRNICLKNRHQPFLRLLLCSSSFPSLLFLHRLKELMLLSRLQQKPDGCRAMVS